MKHCHLSMLCVVWLVTAVTANADIVWSGEQNLSDREQYVDLNADSLTDVILVYNIYTDTVLNPEGSNGFLNATVTGAFIEKANHILVDASNGLDAALPYGTLISDTPDSTLDWGGGGFYFAGSVSSWSTYPPEPDTEWSGLLGETGEAYLGISFDIGDATHYGWVHMVLGEVNPDFGFETPITASWAYESTPDTPIVAGVIPEPSTGILTMVGSIGLLLHARSRRRR
jgi:hypothetical protein